MIKILYIFFIGAGLLACSSVTTIRVNDELLPVTGAYNDANRVDSIIQPYRTELNTEMLEVIAKADHDFTKDRPNGSLNNWSADAIFTTQSSQFEENEAVMCLLNVGGLRNPLSKGEIKLEDIFKLMPFDNEVVYVKLPIAVKKDIEAYLSAKGGEPIAGAIFKEGQLQIDKLDEEDNYFWVITSDYLLGGGDKMDFFAKNTELRFPNELMRDAMIRAAKQQGTLLYSNEPRIFINE